MQDKNAQNMTLQQATTQLKNATSELKQYNETVKETVLHNTVTRLYLTTKVKELIWIVSQKKEQAETELKRFKQQNKELLQGHTIANNTDVI
jgi:hypothetical protein